MKKVLAFVLALVMVLSLVACAGKPAETKPAETKTEAKAEEKTEAKAEEKTEE